MRIVPAQPRHAATETTYEQSTIPNGLLSIGLSRQTTRVLPASRCARARPAIPAWQASFLPTGFRRSVRQSPNLRNSDHSKLPQIGRRTGLSRCRSNQVSPLGVRSTCGVCAGM